MKDGWLGLILDDKPVYVRISAIILFRLATGTEKGKTTLHTVDGHIITVDTPFEMVAHELRNERV